MKIAVGCDHGGLEHKNAIAEHLKSEGFEVEDFGIYENMSVDYPKIALKVANSIKNGFKNLFFFNKALCCARYIIKNGGADFIHAHWLATTSSVAYRLLYNRYSLLHYRSSV